MTVARKRGSHSNIMTLLVAFRPKLAPASNLETIAHLFLET